jgi:drug/metabolite transporter (DMT)-like permease
VSRKGWFLFFLSGLCWGIPYLLIRVAVREVDATVVVFTRVLIGALIFIPITWRSGALKVASKYWKWILFYAFGEMVGPFWLISTAEKHVTSGLAGLLIATTPIWSAIQASFQGDKSVWQRRRLLGMVIGFFGIFLVVGIESLQGKQSLLAIFALLLAAMGYSIAMMTISRKAGAVDGKAINGIAMTITAIIYLPFAIHYAPTHMPSGKAIAALVTLGLIPTALAFFIFFILIAEIGAARGSLVTYLNTAFAVLLGVIILGEPLTLGIVLGLPLVLVGSYFASHKSEGN